MKLTNPSNLTAYWGTQYGVAPVAHRLRASCKERWLRIHALPDSKRYPETATEYAEVLSRHNTLLSHLLCPEGVVLITAGYSFRSDPEQDPLVTDPRAWHWTSMRTDPDDPQSSWCHLYARPLPWYHGALDSVLLLVADDRISNVIVIGSVNRVLYHPYDGGADVIGADGSQRDVMKARFRQWLSPRVDGL